MGASLLALALLFCAWTSQARPELASELMERAIYTEETKGDLSAATLIYRQIVDLPGADRALVALAQLRLSFCELKLGHKSDAISSLQRLTEDFPDKSKLMFMVEQRMPRVLDDMLRQIEQNYILEVDRDELMQTAIQAIVGKVGAQSPILKTNDMSFLGANDMERLTVNMDQKLIGIGAALRRETNTDTIFIETPLPGSPAVKAGLRAGDRILAVNGTPLPKGIELDEVIRQVRGPAGEPVTLSIQHLDSLSPTNVRLVREMVMIQSVIGDHYRPDQTWDFMLDENSGLAYLRLLQLGSESVKEMTNALNQLKPKGLRGLILDLRGNTGGLMKAAVAVAALYIDQGEIVSIKARTGVQTYTADAENTYTGFPMAVLVDRNTAASAEVIAACLQDHHRAIIVGERTSGQGLVRKLIPVGSGGLRLPVAEFYRPSGKSMNRYPGLKESDAWGVSPDPGCEVKLTADESLALEQYLDSREILEDNPPAHRKYTDRQLLKAMEILSAQVSKQ